MGSLRELSIMTSNERNLLRLNVHFLRLEKELDLLLEQTGELAEVCDVSLALTELATLGRKIEKALQFFQGVHGYGRVIHRAITVLMAMEKVEQIVGRSSADHTWSFFLGSLSSEEKRAVGISDQTLQALGACPMELIKFPGMGSSGPGMIPEHAEKVPLLHAGDDHPFWGELSRLVGHQPQAT